MKNIKALSVHGDRWSDCEIQDVIEEIAFQHMDHVRAVASPFSTYLGTAWFLRWIIFTLISSIWFESPRTLYSLALVINIAFIALTALSMDAFHKPDGMLILTEEVLIAFWQGFQLLLFIDLFNGGKFKKGGVWTLSVFIFLCYLGVILIELTLLGYSLVPRVYGPEAYDDNRQSQYGGRNGAASGLNARGDGTAGKAKKNVYEVDGESMQQMPVKIHGQSVPKPSGFDGMGF